MLIVRFDESRTANGQRVFLQPQRLSLSASSEFETCSVWMTERITAPLTSDPALRKHSHCARPKAFRLLFVGHSLRVKF